MSLELSIREGTHTVNSHYNGIDRYKLYFSFNRIGSGSYDLNNYRIRGFFKHHFGLSVLTPDVGYLAGNFTATTGVVVTPSAWYDDWMNDVRPPRIDESGTHFTSEVDIHFTSGTLNGSNTSATDGLFELYGYDNEYKTGRYNDVQESYSYMNGLTSDVKNPLNWILEKFVSSNPIKKISSNGNIVTVITQTAHGYSTGNAIRINGVGGYSNLRQNIDGCRYSGNFNITVVNETTFTYVTKHVMINPISYTNGVCEYWEAHVYETPISSIQGDGSGVITVNTSRAHGLQVDDTVKITGTTHYDGSQLIVTSTSSTTTFICLITGNTYTSIETTGTANYSSRPPSKAIPVNYVSGYEAKDIIDHTTITYLVYASKDTYIDSDNYNGYGRSTNLIASLTKKNTNKKSVFYFPVVIKEIPQLPYAEINTYLTQSDDTYSTMSLHQISTNKWSDNTSYSILNPLIEYDVGNVGSSYIINTGTSDIGLYNKFTLDTDKIKEWIRGFNPSSIALLKDYPQSSHDINYSSTEVSEFKPYLVTSTGDATTSDVTLLIQAQPDIGSVGDIIHIIATQGMFNSIPMDNIVKFNNTPAIVIYGTADRKQLVVKVPNTVEGNPITVISKESDLISPPSASFSIRYSDQVFDSTDTTDRSGLTTISGNVSVFKHGSVKQAIYNRDMSYSGFSELTDENSMIQNVYTMLLTGIGDRMFNLNFGSSLAHKVFSLVGDPDALEIAIIKEITELVNTYEFRVTVSQDTSFVVFDENDNSLKAVIGLILPTGNVPVISLSFKTIPNR